MKYQIELSKTESKSAEVVADNPSEALAKAHESNPGFRGDTVVEIVLDGVEREYGDEHTRHGSCENCDKEFWDDDEFTVTDDGDFCPECVKALQDLV